MYKAYLELWHPIQYNDLILSSKLWTYLADLNEQAQNRLDCIIAKIKEAEGITEELKAHDQMTWVGAMNSIRNRTEEIIYQELLCGEGNIEPTEYDTIACKGYEEVTHLITRNEKKLVATMTDEQKELFSRYTDAEYEHQTMAECMLFQNSFKTGARIMAEIMDDR